MKIIISNNEQPMLCSKCSKSCCKTVPGIFSPQDIHSLTIKYIASKLVSLEWAVDWWQADPDIYYLRPATTNGMPVKDPSWGGVCIYLTPNGCQLTFNNRPIGCRALLPLKNDKCKLINKKYDKYPIIKLWKKYQSTLDKAAKKANKNFKNIKCPTCEEDAFKSSTGQIFCSYCAKSLEPFNVWKDILG